MTWMEQQGLWLCLLSLSLAFPASVCPACLVFWVNPENTEFALSNVPLGGPRGEAAGGGN